jgi:hypothetical protein
VDGIEAVGIMEVISESGVIPQAARVRLPAITPAALMNCRRERYTFFGVISDDGMV